MSAGNFTTKVYQTDAGGFAPIRVQPETLLLAIAGGNNAAPAGEITQEASAIVGGSRRSNGVHARAVRVRFTGAVPDGYQPGGVISLPILNPANFTPIKKGQVGQYLGVGVVVVGKTAEKVN